jgi:catechol 2,3-dioxygenase
MVELGHVVLYVKSMEKSLRFYQDIVGLEVKGRIFNDRAAVLTGGSTHHELLLIEVGAAPGPLQGRRLGLYHVGWKIGEDIDTLRQMKEKIQQQDYPLDGMSDHGISKSLYLSDPDGNEVELFIDDPDYDWLNRSDWMEYPVRPLIL